MPFPSDLLHSLPSPAYVADVPRIRRNLQRVDRLKQETGCTVLLALKAFSMFALFETFKPHLDGTTASGLYEAKLGHEHFGGEVHAYAPAYTAEEIAELAPICSHISFNSVAQLRQFAPAFREQHGEDAVIGLRVNPGLRLVTNSSLYDPSAPLSRFGVQPSVLTDEVLADINLLHVHNLCENMAEDSVRLIEHLMATIPGALHTMQYLNLGGGHYLSHPDYHLDALIDAINRIQRQFDLKVILEPGGALVYDAGWLVATVLDVIENEGSIAVLDSSATCHMPDVLEVPYTPNVVGAGDSPAHTHRYRLTGKTCLTGDVIGDYAFTEPLQPGDRVIFTDMMQYTMVKNTTFNGLPLPAIAAWDGETCRIIKEFGYADFVERLS